MNKPTRIWVASVISYVLAITVVLLAGEALSPAQTNIALF